MKKIADALLFLTTLFFVWGIASGAYAQEIEIFNETGEYMQTLVISDVAPEVSVDKVTENQITLSWSHYDWRADVAGYEVLQYAAATQTYEHVAFTPEQTFTIKDLKTAGVYSFKVRSYAVDENQQLYFGAESSELKAATAPKAVALKSLKYLSTGTVQVKWKKASAGSGYMVQYSTDKKFTDEKNCHLFISGKSKTKTKVKALGKSVYYMRVCPYKKVGDEYFFGAWSNTRKVKVKKGVSLKTMINHYKTDLSGRKEIKALTDNGVDIKKYKTTYDRVKAIYEWHARHGLEFVHCAACNDNFNTCIAVLFGNSRQYDSFIRLADGKFKNSDGSTVMHKWSLLYFSGMPYIFDPRLQSYTKNYKGTLYFGIPKNASMAKRYHFEGWYW